MIEVLDAEHCKINGALVDIPAIQYWIETTSFGSHNPIQAFYNLQALLKRLADGRDVPDAERKAVYFLEKINNHGHYIADEVFSTTPGLYRYVNGSSMVVSWSADTVVDTIFGAAVRPLWKVECHA